MKVGGGEIFLESQVAKIKVLGWLDALRAVKLALQHFCEKHSYVCSQSSVGTGGDARLWVGL